MRNDGRLANGIRKVIITPDYIRHAEGSCLIEIGNTRIICTASIEDGVPHFLRGQGTGWVTAEYGMIPRSCRIRVPREATRGKKGGRTHEIQRLIGRSLRSVCDLAAIGERTIWIDCDIIQADGGTRCGSITGSFVALGLALNKIKTEGILDKIPLTDYIAAISAGIVNGNLLLDLSYEEDSGAEVDMNVVMTGKGDFVEIQGTAETKPFAREDMDKMLDLARKGIDKLVKKQKEVLKEII